jgi:molybdopterin-containing oxidoreductase family membrane subunit
VSVHSIVGLDFAAGLTPGWHSTQWPPYFFIGALFSGWAVVLVFVIPLRRLHRLERIITERHLDILAKFLLATGLMLAYCYFLECFQPLYREEPAEKTELLARVFGYYAPVFWTKTVLNVAVPQLLWWPGLRRNHVLLFLVSLGVVIGMWLERYMFVVSSLAANYMPSEWGLFHPTFWDLAILLGSVGLVLSGLFLFIRLLPVVSMFEIREVLHRERQK